MQPKKSIKFQTVNDVKRAKLDKTWHEGFRMTPLYQDEGEKPCEIVYVYAGITNYKWSEGSQVVSYEDSIRDSREYLYQNRGTIESIIYAVVHRLFGMPSMPYSYFDFAVWNQKQSAIDMVIQIYGAEKIKRAVLAHFKAQTFNELTRALSSISGEEFDFLVYGIKPDKES